MLEALCGNKNVMRILIFLFVNGKCYGTQLHRALGVPLTPLQKALSRLEKGDLISSTYEGKTRLYQFNSYYPLMTELEQLLKKAYTLLPAHEKKIYYLAKEELRGPSKSGESHARLLQTFWERLMAVRQLIFKARSRSRENRGWNGQGDGEVVVTREGSNVLLFNEKGCWKPSEGGEVNFSNVFRWTLDREAGVISLEHLRRGPDNPTFIFHLAISGNRSLSSVDSHLCEGDSYFGQINFDRSGLRLSWRVIGPKKNEELDYVYS